MTYKGPASTLIAAISGLLIALPCASFSAQASTPAPSNQPVSFHTTPRKIYSNQELADILGWVSSKGACHSCGGYYKQPAMLYKHPHPGSAKKLPTRISSRGPSIFSERGYTLLQKDIVLTQPGRKITADKAYIYRNNRTGKITRIHLVGHVRMQELDKLIIAQVATFDLVHHTYHFVHAGYHLTVAKNKNDNTQKKPYDGWGRARFAKRVANGILYLWHATYSTCPPLDPAWHIYASYMRLNKKTGLGVAHNAVIKIKNIPVFYMPYFQFPLDNRRRTGFVGITGGYSSHRGFEIDLPFYWNIAPNVDATIEPRFMSKRGVLTNLTFRYLTAHNKGTLFASFIPNDWEFTHYIKTTLNTAFPNSSQTTIAPYLSALSNMSNNRAYFKLLNHTTLSHDWSVNLIGHYVTDPYYFRDFGVPLETNYTNQLLNEASLNYHGNHWTAKAFAQAYQTLHLIDQIDNPATNQYQRLPEVDANGRYPDVIAGFNINVRSQFVNFVYHSSLFPLFTFQRPVGQRYNMRPSIARPIIFSSGYITPKVTLDSTTYTSQLATTAPGISRPYLSASRNIPIVSIDSGLYFSKHFHTHHHNYTQTLEPRLFYLYTPFVNQNKYPEFDTQLLPFNYNQLFALNRFAGIDRIENADQLSFGLTTRTIDDATGLQKLNMGLGIIYYIEHPRVGIPVYNINTQSNQMVFPRDGRTSPLVGQITYYPFLHWSITGDAAWNFSTEELNNADISMTYEDGGKRILSFGYTLARDVDGISIDTLGLSNDTNLLHGGITWPLTQRWSVLGNVYYNVARHRPNSFYAGLQYSTCCWGIRAVASRSFMGVNPTSTPGRINNEFSNTYYIQILLKGLGSFGNNDPSNILESTLPGYQDPFRTR